jgi:hypothetical protein
MKNLILTLFVLAAFMLSALTASPQQKTQDQAINVEVIQFHTEHRCTSCLKIEKLSKETLTKYYPTIPFRLVNVEDKKNEKIAEQFEAAGSALFLYNTKTGKKKNLTEFAFMKVGNEAAFDAELKKAIAEFIKS